MCARCVRENAGPGGESPTRGRRPGGGDEVRLAEDLAPSRFGRGARVAWRSGAARPPCDHRLLLITAPRIITEQKREESCGPGLVRKSQGKVAQLRPGTLDPAIHVSDEWMQVELA